MTMRGLLCGIVALGSLGLASGHPAAADPEPGINSDAARLETFELPSPLVDTSIPGGTLQGGRSVPKVNVLLPAGYDDHPDQEYPVLWLLHGAGGGTDNWLGNIAELAEGLPAILVMPDGGRFGMYVDWWNAGERGAPAWASYHLQVVRDTIEARYRIRPERRWHAIAGISMGGQGALRYAALLPGYFGSVAAFSAAMPDMRALETQVGLTLLSGFNGASGVSYQDIFGSAGGPYAAGNSPRALVANYEHTRMYLTVGNGRNCPGDPMQPTYWLDIVTETFLHAQQAPFAADARAAGADVTEVVTCGVHTFGVWDRAFAAARAWGFFEPVPEQPESWVYRTVATSGEMWGLDHHFDEPPRSVVEFRWSGGTLTVKGAEDVQIGDGPGCRLHARRTSCEVASPPAG